MRRPERVQGDDGDVRPLRAARRATGSRAGRTASSYFGLTKWQRVSLPITRRLSRTVSAIQERGEAPTTAMLRGANSGRRSMAAGHGRAPPVVRRRHPTTAPDAALLERPGDDQALDLGGALPDPIDAELAEEALGRVLAHVAAAAEHLDDAIRAAEGRLRGEQLGERRLGVDDLADRRPNRRARPPRGSGAGRRTRRRRNRPAGTRRPGSRRSARRTGCARWPTRRRARAAAPSPRCSAPRCGSAPRRTTRWSGRPPRPTPPSTADAGTRTSRQDELRVPVGERVHVVRVVLDGRRRACRSRRGTGSAGVVRRRPRGSGRS